MTADDARQDAPAPVSDLPMVTARRGPSWGTDATEARCVCSCAVHRDAESLGPVYRVPAPRPSWRTRWALRRFTR